MRSTPARAREGRRAKGGGAGAGGAGQERWAAEGWARGDVAAALSAQRGYEKCLGSLPEGANVAARAMADSADAIAAALAVPGHSVAVVNLRTLLAQGG